ncbi:MAG: thioredoxin family protein [Alphaproteobacteria bacterium]|nr:thioredoxin family protein [Alphaproteobacteria bacterium]
MIQRFVLPFLLAASVLVFPVRGNTAPEDSSVPLKVEILSEQGTIHPGESLWIAIEQTIEPHWHTYWVNPGDSGAAPRLQWTLPPGFEISGIQWPIPEKIPYGPLLNYGYSDHVTLLQKLTAPATLPDGPLTLSARADILVCQEICIPAFSSHEIVLNHPAQNEAANQNIIESALAALPTPTDTQPLYQEDQGNFILTFSSPPSPEIQLESLELFPQDWGIVENTARPEISRDADGSLRILQRRSDRVLEGLENFSGLIAWRTAQGERRAYEFKALQGAPVSVSPVTGASLQMGSSFFQALLLAFLGGMVLNLMPCVFPVLSIKALGLVKLAHDHPEQARLHGLAYLAGVVLSFLTVALILLGLKAGGAEIGWGFQLQNPLIVSFLAYVMFLAGLNLSGFFEVSNPFANVGHKQTQGQALSGSFFTGILATLVATPCTAPFMAAAIGFTLTQGAFVTLAVFAALGLGLALPYVLLSFLPTLQKALPRPGAWMDIFKQLLAFPMFAAAAWLVWVLTRQAGTAALLAVLSGMIGLAFVLWLFRNLPAAGWRRKAVKILGIFLLASVALFLPVEKTLLNQNPFGEAYTPEKLETLLQGSDPVFVEMTADWCITCKVNHRIALSIPSTRALFEKHGVQYLIGDWTNRDAAITKFLSAAGRGGVPVYVYYGPPGTDGHRPEPVVLPQILTPGVVRNAIENP